MGHDRNYHIISWLFHAKNKVCKVSYIKDKLVTWSLAKKSKHVENNLCRSLSSTKVAGIY